MAKTLRRFKAEILASPDARRAYEGQAAEYAIARAIIAVRTARGLTQADLAARMRTSQSFIARLESGRIFPSTRTLLKIAQATKSRPVVEFDLS
jgi:ribosome-binding protein aMBF1 (putative translation factor)